MRRAEDADLSALVACLVAHGDKISHFVDPFAFTFE